MITCLKKQSLNSSNWKHNGQKAARQRKHHGFTKKGKTLTLCSNLEIADGGDVVVDEDVDEWEPQWLVTGPSDSITVSDFKTGKQVLNSRLRPVLQGGGMVLTHYLITWLEMDGQHDTRGGSSSRPRALLKNFQFPHGFEVRPMNTKCYNYFDWGRQYI